MNILIIENNEYKQISDSLNRILENPNIIWMNSRNSGLVSFNIRNKTRKLSPYHPVITSNYLPLNSTDSNISNVEPFASDIVNEIRRLGFLNIPIIICSEEVVEKCNTNYFIKYKSNIELDKYLKNILDDIKTYMIENNLSLIDLANETNHINTYNIFHQHHHLLKKK